MNNELLVINLAAVPAEGFLPPAQNRRRKHRLVDNLHNSSFVSMTIDYRQFVKDISKIDLDDICSDWQWLLNNEYSPIMVTLSGDIFLSDKGGSIHWLDTGTGQLKMVAQSSNEFFIRLEDIDNIDNWLLASAVLDLIESGLVLKENQVYSYKIMPIMNGDYSVANFDATDMSVHFSMTGQICRQLQNVPEGTKIDKVMIQPPNFGFH